MSLGSKISELRLQRAYERLNARIAITQDINEKLSINSTLGYTQSRVILVEYSFERLRDL